VASSARRLRVIAALALVSMAACRATRRAPSPSPSTAASTAPPSRAAGPAELGLLAPLTPGSVLGGFTVREIHAVEHGLLRVVCARDKKDKEVVRLDVALAAPEGALPPATAGRYAIFYSLRGAMPEDADRLANELAAVIKGNAAAPAPAGMTTFTPEAKPGTAL
jgi:hypothetical protein